MFVDDIVFNPLIILRVTLNKPILTPVFNHPLLAADHHPPPCQPPNAPAPSRNVSGQTPQTLAQGARHFHERPGVLIPRR